MAEALRLASDSNRIYISGALAITDYRRVIAALHSVVVERAYRDVTLDFSGCTFTHAPPMLALICQCIVYRSRGVDFSLGLPADPGLNRLFVNSSWAHFIEPERFPAAVYAPTRHNRLTQFVDSSEQSRLINEVMDTLLASFTKFERSHLAAIEWSLNEISDNVLVHAQSEFGGLVQVTAIRGRKRVEFVVADAGIGIAKSLRSTHHEISSDVDALSKAIQEGVTRDVQLGQGNGLYGSYRIAVTSGGNFSIHSNYATLYYAESSGMHSKNEAVPISGSIVTCGIEYESPLLLEEALRFKDKPHSPVDRIELHYESDSNGNILFAIHKEATSVGSRVAGTPVRNKLLNLLRLCDAALVIVDFEAVHMISSSFADEVFGKLFVGLGALEFSSKFQFRNIDPVVKKLIDRAILQRAAVRTAD